MKDRKKSYERQANIAVGLLIFIICGIPTLLMLALHWFLSDARSMGMMGFVQAIIYRLLGIMTAIVVVIIIEKAVQNKSSAVKQMVKTAGIVLCITASVLLVCPLVLDIPYLSHPETMYLHDLEFEDDSGDALDDDTQESPGVGSHEDDEDGGTSEGDEDDDEGD